MSRQPKTYRPVGYWANESVPDLAGWLEPHGIHAGEFAAWLGPLLGRYRGHEDVRDVLEVPPAEQVAALQGMREALRNVLPLLRPGALPPKTEALLFYEGHIRGIDGAALRNRLNIDGHTLAILLAEVERKIGAQPGRRGRKPKRSRDALLAAVVQRMRDLGCSAADAQTTAEHVLVACRVEVQQDERARRRAVSKVTGSK